MSTRILLLDDDQKMFQALNRLVRPLEVILLTAASPARALEFCEDYDIQLVIADLNRNDVDVIDFFCDVQKINPLTRKIVLTSYADLDSTVSAINAGKVNRYFTKPWDACELRTAIYEELNEYFDQLKKSEQVSELGKVNEEMEEKAEFTSKLLNGTVEMLAGSRYRAAISMSLELLGSRVRGARRFAKRSAATAGMLAEQLGLDRRAREEISLAAELHQIGMLALPDSVLKKPYESMSQRERDIFETYPEMGAKVLLQDGEEDEIVRIVRHHREDNNGGGYPSQLVGIFIPLGARILRVALDYEQLSQELGPDEAIDCLLKRGNKVYDQKVLDALVEVEGFSQDLTSDNVKPLCLT